VEATGYLNAKTEDLSRALDIQIGKLPLSPDVYQKLSKETTRYSMVFPEYNDIEQTVHTYTPNN